MTNNKCTLTLGVFQSGQMGQTVNLLSFDFGGSNPSAPTNARRCFSNAAFPQLAARSAEIAQSIEH